MKRGAMVRIRAWLGGQKDSMSESILEPGLLTDGCGLPPSMQEWLETDGLGGFASSTTLGINTRRYHGFLFLSGRDPGERHLVLSKVMDRCEGADGSWELSSDVYPGVIHPDGAKNLLEFRRYPFPSYVYRIGKRLLIKEVFMVSGRKGVFCVYRLLGERRDDTGLNLTIRPLLNNRFYHHTGKEGAWSPEFEPQEGAVAVSGHYCGPFLLSCSSSSFYLKPVWYKNMLYPRERERGLDYSEDHLCPGEFRACLKSGEEVVMWAGPLGDRESTREHTVGLKAVYASCRAREETRRHALLGDEESLPGKLAFAADQFIVKSPQGSSILAGYHWFGEWGRDSFISLPGVCLAYKRYGDAREVFLRFIEAMRGGLVPNCFQEGCGAAHNAADASLWMIRALALYESASGDKAFVDSLVPAVRDIVKAYVAGTSYSIRMDSSGLLWAGDKDTQVTWMDACSGGFPVTPRAGMPVEVNALWICALFALAKWESRLGKSSGRYLDLGVSATKEFVRLFTWPEVGLYDRLSKEGPVWEIRPNQVLAASILGSVLPRETLRAVAKTATRALVTPVGLRTLAPMSPDYVGSYGGDPGRRDRAYHQGTAWPWLAWPYLDLLRKAYSPMPEASFQALLSRSTAGFMDVDGNPCTGSVFEVASGDVPHTPGGAVAQAWSVAAASYVSKTSGREAPTT